VVQAENLENHVIISLVYYPDIAKRVKHGKTGLLRRRTKLGLDSGVGGGGEVKIYNATLNGGAGLNLFKTTYVAHYCPLT
jgi:hypothetical protein